MPYRNDHASPSVLVVGSANLDLVVTAPRLPTAGETLIGRSLQLVPGGKGLNQAVAAARAGARVDFVGAVGDDDHGRRLTALLADEGVRTDGIRVRPDHPTGTAHIAVADDGENHIIVVPGANTTVEAPPPEQLAGASLVVLQLEIGLPVVVETARSTRAAGIPVVLTPAPAPPDGLPAELLAATDLIVPNGGEARSLTGEPDDRSAAAALSRSVRMVAMTRGADGVVIATGGRIVADLPAPHVEAVDTTGAGDAFTGALVAELAATSQSFGADAVVAAARRAVVAAALSVTRTGASSSSPTADEIDRALSATGDAHSS